jgi:hypothetical protein
MITCPVCKKPVQDVFVLNGHLRPSKDLDHQVCYLKQKKLQKKESPTQLNHNPELKQSPTEDLRTFLKKYAADHQENQELSVSIERLLEVDRKYVGKSLRTNTSKVKRRCNVTIQNAFRN